MVSQGLGRGTMDTGVPSLAYTSAWLLFPDRSFEAEINYNNPLGTGGRLAIGFAVLLRALWKGTHHAFQPSKLKAIVASKASQFTGYAQHDAQEFMAFLLDGLHEDLNRIQNKPYTETVDSDGRPDEVRVGGRGGHVSCTSQAPGLLSPQHSAS